MVDKELLYETLDAVIAADAVGDWDQKRWVGPSGSSHPHSCGTAGCFAGWRAVLDGYTWRTNKDNRLLNPRTGHEVYIPDHARERLGLNGEQTFALFLYKNTLDDLKYIVDEIAGGHDGSGLADQVRARREREEQR
jgi:hypothetical protein